MGELLREEIVHIRIPSTSQAAWFGLARLGSADHSSLARLGPARLESGRLGSARLRLWLALQLGLALGLGFSVA